jgi:hypothetical protein
MEKLFVPFELALALKEKGFDKRCFTKFNPNNKQLQSISGFELPSDFILAPIYQQVVDWFREDHKIHIQIFIGHDEDKIWYNFELEPVVLGYNYEPHTCDTDVPAPYTYNDTLNKAINEALKLI